MSCLDSQLFKPFAVRLTFSTLKNPQNEVGKWGLTCISFCFVFSFWRGGQPDNGAGDPGNQNENCVEMEPKPGDGKWNDENCIALQYYVCARDISKYGWSVIFHWLLFILYAYPGYMVHAGCTFNLCSHTRKSHLQSSSSYFFFLTTTTD